MIFIPGDASYASYRFLRFAGRAKKPYWRDQRITECREMCKACSVARCNADSRRGR